MNLCFICNEYPPGPHGGIGTSTQVLSRALAQAGHQVLVIGHYSPTYPAPDYEDNHGVRVWRLRGSISHGRWILGRYRLFRQVQRWAHAREIDLVEVPDYQGMAAFWPQLNVPVIVRVHSSRMYNAQKTGRIVFRLGSTLTHQSLLRADCWCAVSQYAADRTRQYFGLSSSASAVLYNPVETKMTNQPKRRNSHSVMFSGTLNENKGVISLIRAWNQITRSFPAAQLHLYGKDGGYNGIPMREYLNGVMNAQARGSVVFHGHVTREVLFEALQTARLAVFPSYSEAFAVAPLESMVNGCPTVFTKRTSGPELVDDGVNGLLVDPDDPDEIAAAISWLLEDDELAQRLGDAGRKLIHGKYSTEALLPQNIRFYEECIATFKAVNRC